MRAFRPTQSWCSHVAAYLCLLGCASATPWAQDRCHADAAVDGLCVLSADEPAKDLKRGKVLRALRVEEAPVLDGSLSDEVWQRAAASGGFLQRDPDNGSAMTEQTQMQVIFDERDFYVALVVFDSAPSDVASGLGRRDERPSTDLVTIAIDPRHDHLTGYAFETNPSGWQGDYAYYDDDRTDADYNPVWEVRTAVSKNGWSVEARIPFSQLRFDAAPGNLQVWGLNIYRTIHRKSEKGAWVAKPREARGEVSLFGHLVFNEALPHPRRIEFVPYALAATTSRYKSSARAGVDMRVGIGTGATLSATINPDFGHVEQDPAVLNLSVFETFFPEKRPFFLEDSRTFVPPYGNFQLFHSRRIGASPQQFRVPRTEAVVDQPDDTTIVGATKLTGKSSGWTFGALTALTAAETAWVRPTAAEALTASRPFLLEPMTSYNAARVQRDIRSGSSNVGALVTAVVRRGSDDAFTGGIDYNLRWNRNRVRWNGHWAITHAPGPGGVRTDGGGVTNLLVSSKYWATGLHYDHFGRHFRVTDLGFLRSRTNRNEANGFFEVSRPDPWKVFRRAAVSALVRQGWTDERLVFSRSLENQFSVQFLSFWAIDGGAGVYARSLDDLDTRGGPPIVKPASRYFFVNVASDSRRSWQWMIGSRRERTEAGGFKKVVQTGLSLQPADRVQASTSASYERARDAAQWILNVDSTGDGVSDNIYGTLSRDVVDVTARGTLAFTTSLTLQGFVQRFIAVGDYEAIRRLARPMSYEFEPTTISENPNFNRRSLRANIVMRWEYVRGSTLFVVWDISKPDASYAGRLGPLPSTRTKDSESSSHRVSLKLTYWLHR